MARKKKEEIIEIQQQEEIIIEEQPKEEVEIKEEHIKKCYFTKSGCYREDN